MNLHDILMAAKIAENSVISADLVQKSNVPEIMQEYGIASKAKKYELIETITITEPEITVIERTAEPDGTPYDFEKLIYTIECEPAESSATGWVSVNDIGNYGYSSAMVGTAKTFVGGSLRVENGRLIGDFCVERSGISTIGAVRNYGHGIGTNEAEKIEKIRILTQSTAQFPVGSVIKIHAVRR